MKLFNLPLMTNPLVASARVLGQPLEAMWVATATHKKPVETRYLVGIFMLELQYHIVAMHRTTLIQRCSANSGVAA